MRKQLENESIMKKIVSCSPSINVTVNQEQQQHPTPAPAKQGFSYIPTNASSVKDKRQR